MKPPDNTPRSLTEEEIRQATIEALELERHAYKMQIAAIEKRLAILGRVYKNEKRVGEPASPTLRGRR